MRQKPKGKFGKALAKARTAMGLTQAQVAELLGVQTNSVARWERGESTPPKRDELPLCQEEILERVAKQK